VTAWTVDVLYIMTCTPATGMTKVTEKINEYRKDQHIGKFHDTVTHVLFTFKEIVLARKSPWGSEVVARFSVSAPKERQLEGILEAYKRVIPNYMSYIKGQRCTMIRRGTWDHAPVIDGEDE